ncbi:MAG: DUF2309 family protein, partial [Nitrospirales bacterium]|nr:DUF2309 family protein [Nitrospirales bacterium]
MTTIPYSEAQRMEVRSLVNLAGEVIAYYWPMRTFIYRNVLHGLEYLDFEDAVKQGQRFLGGRPYLPNNRFRDYFQIGRIRIEDIDAALTPLIQGKTVMIGKRPVTHLEVLRAQFLQGIKVPDHGHQERVRGSLSERANLEAVANRLRTVLRPPNQDARVQTTVLADTQALGHDVTLSAWCDQILGTRIVEQINEELIKWCGAFVDEGHAAWTMPHRETSFYNAWKHLAQHDFSGTFLGIQDWKHKIQSLPERPEDTILRYLETLGIPKILWEDYLSLQLGALPGWTGFIKWRAEEAGYEWQAAFPASLVKYLAIRLFYERELVHKACRTELGIAGDYTALLAFMQDQAHVHCLRHARVTGILNQEFTQKVDRLRYRIPRASQGAWQTLADHYSV